MSTTRRQECFQTTATAECKSHRLYSDECSLFRFLKYAITFLDNYID